MSWKNIKLTVKQVEEILIAYLIDGGWTQQALAEEYGVTEPTISAITTGKTWTNVRPDIPRGKKKRKSTFKQIQAYPQLCHELGLPMEISGDQLHDAEILGPILKRLRSYKWRGWHKKHEPSMTSGIIDDNRVWPKTSEEIKEELLVGKIASIPVEYMGPEQYQQYQEGSKLELMCNLTRQELYGHS